MVLSAFIIRIYDWSSLELIGKKEGVVPNHRTESSPYIEHFDRGVCVFVVIEKKKKRDVDQGLLRYISLFSEYMGFNRSRTSILLFLSILPLPLLSDRTHR